MLAHHAFDYIYRTLQKYPGNYFEIGIYEGDAIAQLGKEYSHKKIYAVDPFIEDGYTNWLTRVEKDQPLGRQRELAYRNIQGISNVELFEMTSKDFAVKLTEEQINTYNINIVFIDGSHHYNDVFADCILAMRLLAANAGELVFDDTNLEGVELALDQFLLFAENRIIGTVEIEPNCKVVKLKSL